MECCQAVDCSYFSLQEPGKHEPPLCMAACCVAVYEEVHLCCEELWQLVADVEFSKADLMPGGAGIPAAAAFSPWSRAAACRLFDAAAGVADCGVAGVHGLC